jgi:signal transduction histidine kinase
MMHKFAIENFPFLNLNILMSRVSWSITLRWLAVSGYFLATVVARYVFNLNLPYTEIWIILGVLTVINVIYLSISKIFKKFSFIGEIVFLQFHIIIDLLFLTAIIHYSGGVENPVYLFYAFHVILSSIIFPGRTPIVIATLVVILFSSLLYLEYNGILPHYSIFATDLYSNELFIYLTLVVFTITVYVTMYICLSFMYIYREVKRQIDQQNEQLIEADKQKSQFFRFTSHELKSPVVAVQSSIDGVLKNFGDELDDRARNLLQRASNRSSQMLDIIRELLELSKNRSRVIKNREMINVNQLIQDTIDQHRVLTEEKELCLDLALSEEELMIYGHEESFKDLVQNLFNNAIRYNKEKGSIRVVTEDLGSAIRLIIQDTGIGISEEAIPKIFDEFFRSENAKKEVKIGTGLGLSIVKQIVDNYDGTIDVTSGVGEGTQFTIIFPKRTSSPIDLKGSKDK